MTKLTLFKTELSRLISKLSFISNLNLLELDAKISASSKFIGKVTLQQVVRYCRLFSVFNTFSREIRSSHHPKRSSKIMS